MERKYELTDEKITVGSTTLYRIRALCNIGNLVKIGDLGGFVESEDNLSITGLSWVGGNAQVYGNAQVCGNARVYGNARVCDNALVCGYAQVCDDALVYDDAQVYGNARVCDNAQVCGNARVCGYAQVCDDALVYGNARVYGNALVYGYAQVCDNAQVYDDALVYGNARVCDNAQVCDNAVIRNARDYIVFKNWWSSGRHFTWTRSNDKWKVGCFHGTGQELIAKAYKDSELSGREYERVVNYVESIKNTIGKL